MRAAATSCPKVLVGNHRPAHAWHSSTARPRSPSDRRNSAGRESQAGQVRTETSPMVPWGWIAMPQWWQNRAESLMRATQLGQIVWRSRSWTVKSASQKPQAVLPARRAAPHCPHRTTAASRLRSAGTSRVVPQEQWNRSPTARPSASHWREQLEQAISWRSVAVGMANLEVRPRPIRARPEWEKSIYLGDLKVTANTPTSPPKLIVASRPLAESRAVRTSRPTDSPA